MSQYLALSHKKQRRQEKGERESRGESQHMTKKLVLYSTYYVPFVPWSNHDFLPQNPKFGSLFEIIILTFCWLKKQINQFYYKRIEFSSCLTRGNFNLFYILNHIHSAIKSYLIFTNGPICSTIPQNWAASILIILLLLPLLSRARQSRTM